MYFSSGIVITAAGTVAVAGPMIQIIRMRGWKGEEPKALPLPSVKETILDAVSRSAKPTLTTPPAAPPKPAPAAIASKPKVATAAPKPPPQHQAAVAVAQKPQALTAPSAPVQQAWKTLSSRITELVALIKVRLGESVVRIESVLKSSLIWARANSRQLLTVAGVAAVSMITLIEIYSLYAFYAERQRLAKLDDSQVVQFYLAPRSPIAPSVSTPCIRVEAFLRLAKIPHNLCIIGNDRLSPSGSVPCIRFKGACLSEPSSIIEYLSKKFHVEMDNRISEKEHAVALALAATLEYSVQRGYDRSLYVDHTEIALPYFAGAIHASKRRVMEMMRSLNFLNKQQYEFQLLQDVQAVENIIGSKRFVLGDAPSSYDCAVYAALLPIVAMEESADVNEPFGYVVQSEILTGYVNRFTRIAFPDLDELVCHQHEGKQSAVKS